MHFSEVFTIQFVRSQWAAPRTLLIQIPTFDMEYSQSQDYHTPEAAYHPQNVNEQDQAMGGVEEQQNGHSNGHPQSGVTSPQEKDSGSRYNSPNLAYQQQPSSRPGSGMGQPAQPYQDQNRQQPSSSKSSVVIKVGMVGDAQIGKTSLMVKYVEGSWDEDYIQTLGKEPGVEARSSISNS